MKIRYTVGAAAALALFGFSAVGCGDKATPGGENSAGSLSAASSATSSASAPNVSQSASTTSSPAVVAATDARPSREFLIGKWGTDGDCTLAIELRQDGTSDGPFGNWSYDDGVISFADEPDFKVSVTVIDDNTMESTNGAGKPSKMTRCPR
jgi:hypothetical protein